ncbi:MAG: sigma-70 family RNA polymerase sigma factor [Deltaproteobacteria bacterium]|nr:sigma-70 family RNA polymerase sigma factor [Deltaproteobacteria bacterium]
MTVSTPSLVRPFLDAAPAGVRAVLEAVPDLERRLFTLVAEGRAAWPDFPIDGKDVVSFIGRQVTDELAADALEGLRPADLYLACACAKGLTAAINAFDRDYMKEVDIALARMRIGPPRLSDVKQLVRQRLFVGGGTAGTPTSVGKIAEYGGRGDLRRWVRSVAVRTCLNELRKGKREILVDDDHLIAQHAVAQDDPEVEYMKKTYSTEFKTAFSDALAQLGAREQTLLRYHHVDGLNIDEIGAIYRVHRVTAFRWLEKAKELLVKQTLETLRARLKLPASELESVLRMIRSQIHLSIVRQLGGPTDKVDDDAMELDPSELEEVEST